MTEQPRWQLRFVNYQKAYQLLYSGFHDKPLAQMSLLEKEGLIQRFEYTIELAWKTLKDYLESQNVELEEVTPRTVIREALMARVISDGDGWLESLDDRNKMSHTYNFAAFEAVLVKIRDRYLPNLGALQNRLLSAQSHAAE